MSKLKGLEDFQKYQRQAKEQIEYKENQQDRIIIGMGTCGIAAGAREVLDAIKSELEKYSRTDVLIMPTGCIGMCEQEVLVDIERAGEERVTYGNVTPENVVQIIDKHLINGEVFEELVVGKPIRE